MTMRGQEKPDWAIIGVRDLTAGTCVIIASKQLQRGTLETECINPDEALGRLDYGFLRQEPIYEYRIELTMDGYTIVVGPDYETCLRNLFATWSPVTDQPALGHMIMISKDAS